MAAIPTTNDRDADRGRSSPAGRTDEPIRPEETPGGGSADITEATLNDAAGDDSLVQGGEAPGIDSPPGSIRPVKTPGGGSADVPEATLDAAAGDDSLVQGGEAPGIDSPPGSLPDPGDTSRPAVR